MRGVPRTRPAEVVVPGEGVGRERVRSGLPLGHRENQGREARVGEDEVKREPFVFNFRKPKTCKVCGKTVMMLRGQKTCDECRKKSDLVKTSIPKWLPPR